MTTDNTQAEIRETDLDHQDEDVVTKALVGFANDLLAYEDRMERVDSPILFIHKYVEKRKRQFDSIITAHANKQVEEVLDSTKTAIVELYNLEEWQLTDVVNAIEAERNKLKGETR